MRGLGVLVACALTASAVLPIVSSADAALQSQPAKPSMHYGRKRLSGPSGIALPSSSGIGSFTPAASDPRRAAIGRLAGLSGSGFHFTPSAAPGSRHAVTVAVRARSSLGRSDPQHGGPVTNIALAPSAYNLGVSIGWKKFALSGDYARVDGALLPVGSEAMNVGVSYSNRQWSTRLQFGSDRSIGQHPALIGTEQSYSVDLGTSYALTRNLELAGGVRYKMQRDRVEAISDQRRDSQSVYIGTAFRF